MLNDGVIHLTKVSATTPSRASSMAGDNMLTASPQSKAHLLSDAPMHEPIPKLVTLSTTLYLLKGGQWGQQNLSSAFLANLTPQKQGVHPEVPIDVRKRR
jgi:hypothetical protein